MGANLVPDRRVSAVLGSARRAARTMRKRDPLLTAARLALVAAMGVSGLVTTALVVATPTVLVMKASVLASLVSRGAPPESIWAVVGVLAVSAIVAALSWFINTLSIKYTIFCYT